MFSSLIRKSVLALGIAAIAVSAASAHHSFNAVFNMADPTEVKGTVTQFDFVNPHGSVYLDVKDSAGHIIKWRAELTNPNALVRLGWSKDVLKPGDQVTVEGPKARDGSNFLMGRSWVLANGKKLFGEPANLGR